MVIVASRAMSIVARSDGCDDERRPAAEDRVVFVLALFGVAGIAPLLEADDVGKPEVPASRPLAKISADRALIAELHAWRWIAAAWARPGKLLMISGCVSISTKLHQRTDFQARFASPSIPSMPGIVLRFTTRLGTRIRSFMVVSKSWPPDMGRADFRWIVGGDFRQQLHRFIARLSALDHSKAFMTQRPFRSGFARGP